MKKYIPLDKDDSRLFLKKQVSQDNSVKIINYYNQKESYYSIERNLLFPDSDVPFSLFVKTDFDYNLMLEASENSPAKITTEILNATGDISIKTSDLPLYNEYIKSLDKTLNTSNLDHQIKAGLIKEKTKIVVKNILASPKSGENIKKASLAVEQMIRSILSNNNVLHDLISVKDHDYYTYVHCVNVTILCIGLGIAVNLTQEEIFNLGLGALLHDIGKVAIPSKIINKTGRLTSSEYKIMQNHVIEGVKILEEKPSFPKDSLSTVAQHHERLSGKGYPFHLSGAKITKYGKIIAITDSYDALTTERPTKQALIPFEALSIIVNECEHYDSEYLASFIKMLGRLEE
jgi:putative nucleotidyltransferase with HDIG domain